MKMRIVITVYLILLTCSAALCRQDDEILISGNFENLSFSAFSEKISTETGFRFYFEPGTLDSLVINLQVQHESIHRVLHRIFENTDFNFAIDKQKHVFIVKGNELQTQLPPGFFENESPANPNYKIPNYYLENEMAQNSNLLAEAKQYDVGKRTNPIGTGKATVAGHIKSAATGEPIVGASVYVENPFTGVSSDQFGYFTLTIPKGKHEIIVKSMGMKNTRRKITLYSDGKLDIEMIDEVTSLKEVVIESEKDKNVSSMQMGLDKIDIKTMKKIPVALGEVDILKVMLTLPGVQSVGEATTGLNVRGGATSQNLILLNDATIFNPAHLFGFFSAFNPDLIKSAELYKSSMPAGYGGRISSVLEVNSREGNKKKITGVGGIGPLTGRLVVEGPIIKDKTSFLIGGRSTYSDWLLKQIPNDAIKHSKASFYDLNLVLSHEIDDRNTVYATGYYSKDKFTLNSDTLYSYQNKAATLKWKHIFGNKLYGVVTGSYTGYNFRMESDEIPVNAFALGYAINQLTAKVDFNYFPIQNHAIDFGISAIRYNVEPGSYLPNHAASEVTRDVLADETGVESALYLSDQYDISKNLSVYAGLRYSFYNYLGPHDTYRYAEGQPKSLESILDTLSHAKGKSIARYYGPEYRVSVKYAINQSASVKVSYNRTRQYIQMLSNTTAITPTDVWKLTDTYIKPQVGDQISLGLYKNFRANTIEVSLEGYYKTMQNSLDYKGGAEVIMNHAIEADVINARGKAYGIEFMAKKLSGKVNGWVSYTYSRSLLRTESNFESETVNNGKYYPSNYDKPHAVNIVGNYKFSHRVSSSFNATYSTGRPITLPLAKYYSDGAYRVLYGPRNESRIPDYFRIDVSLNIEGNHKIKKLTHSSWTIGVYNLTGRRNAYSIFFDTQGEAIKGYKLSIFGSPIPTVTYNFKF